MFSLFNHTGSFFFTGRSTIQPIKPAPKPIDIGEFPKASLHTHLEGTISRAVAEMLLTKYDEKYHLREKYKQKYKEDLDLDKIYDKNGKIIHTDFVTEFLPTYDKLAELICCPEALTDVTYEYLKSAHANNSIYEELTVSPDHLAKNGMDYDQVMTAIKAGMDKAEAEFKIESNIIVAVLRHGRNPEYGPALDESKKRAVKEAHELADLMIKNKPKYPFVVGAAFPGDEVNFPPELFEGVFAKLSNAEFPVTAHAGEWTNAHDVTKAVLCLSAKRIDHALHAAFDPKALALLKRKGVSVTCCPASNHDLNTREKYPAEHRNIDHPISLMHKAGIAWSLGTDDPPFFGKSGATLNGEYEFARKTLNLSDAETLAITTRAVQTSFAPDNMKQRLLQRVQVFGVDKGIIPKPAGKQAFDIPSFSEMRRGNG